MYVGDPQVGASKGQSQNGEDLVADEGAANTAARNDGFAWNRTLTAATEQNPDINFMISAGDQVNKTGKPKEEEYDSYLASDYGTTAAGGDYYYTYGDGLFIVLNTNNYNVAEHEQLIKEATEANPDTAWRIVTIHQDIYGSGLDHSDTDGMILRTHLTPIFDSYDIDVILQGHDHTYSHSKLLYGDGQTDQSVL